MAFNSLSRDHTPTGTSFTSPCGLSTPSLGITGRGAVLCRREGRLQAFNSLSRDHPSPRRRPWAPSLLSTPSLGITSHVVEKLERYALLERLSTPSLGITDRLCQSAESVQDHGAGFQLPLSGSLGIEIKPGRGRQLTTFNSLSRDHCMSSSWVRKYEFCCFQLPLSGSRDHQALKRSNQTAQHPFNSLSRDHRLWLFHE